MKVNVIIFGPLTEITGCGSLIVPDIRDTEMLEQFLYDRYPAFKKSKYAIAVDKNIVHEKTILSDDSTVALLPPFSGG